MNIWVTWNFGIQASVIYNDSLSRAMTNGHNSITQYKLIFDELRVRIWSDRCHCVLSVVLFELQIAHGSTDPIICGHSSLIRYWRHELTETKIWCGSYNSEYKLYININIYIWKVTLLRNIVTNHKCISIISCNIRFNIRSNTSSLVIYFATAYDEKKS